MVIIGRIAFSSKVTKVYRLGTVGSYKSRWKDELFVDIRGFGEAKTVLINFGPQHPSAHGVLRLLLALVGEKVGSADPHIGLLHGGTEKLIEVKSVLDAAPYVDGFDYVSMMAQEHSFAVTVEALTGVWVPSRSRWLRVIFLELTGLLNHLLSLTTHALDVGAMTPFLWLFEEREKIMEFYEGVSGAGMHSNWVRPGGVVKDIPLGLSDDVFGFSLQFISGLDELEEILTRNGIWRDGLLGIGQISYFGGASWGFTGVMLGSLGCSWDLRHVGPYEGYGSVTFKVPLAINGDCLDGYLLGVEEMRQSIIIILQALCGLKPDLISEFNQKVTGASASLWKLGMAELIQNFQLVTGGIFLPGGSMYTGVEAPKGEFGVYILSKGSGYVPLRCKFRAPGFYHLQATSKLVGGFSLTDVVTVIGTQDVVFGEIDR